PAPSADERDVPLPLRGDTFLGVFEGIGEELGFNPNWLRIPFSAMLLWNPVAILASYLALGVALALARWLFPAAKRPPAEAGEADRNHGNGQAPADSRAKDKQDEEDLLAA
ncbi:MAG: PspC domain-containing protein, partial [Alphaproteobacteria bacterium]